MARGDARVAHLVVALGFEPDRIGARGLAADLSQDSRDGRAVRATAEEGADRAVPRGKAHTLAQRTEELVLELRGRALLVLGVTHLPVGAGLLPSPAPAEQAARQQTPTAGVDRVRTGHHVEVD